jgi:hypothetical protein
MLATIAQTVLQNPPVNQIHREQVRRPLHFQNVIWRGLPAIYVEKVGALYAMSARIYRRSVATLDDHLGDMLGRVRRAVKSRPRDGAIESRADRSGSFGGGCIAVPHARAEKLRLRILFFTT